MKNTCHVVDAFYSSIPDCIYWPILLVATAASDVASQATILAGFKNQSQIGNASGTAVVIVMLVTTLLMILVMLLLWRCHWILVLIFTGLSLTEEVLGMGEMVVPFLAGILSALRRVIARRVSLKIQLKRRLNAITITSATCFLFPVAMWDFIT
ncbi:hypothetical protein OIU76_028348, partial [Salix suchowensis]